VVLVVKPVLHRTHGLHGAIDVRVTREHDKRRISAILPEWPGPQARSCCLPYMDQAHSHRNMSGNSCQEIERRGWELCGNRMPSDRRTVCVMARMMTNSAIVHVSTIQEYGKKGDFSLRVLLAKFESLVPDC